MTTLITQLENLKGPSREVDAEIAKAMGWKSFTWEFAGRCGLTWYAPLNSVGRPQPPNYTGSIDAALTLVPEGCEIELTNMYGVARAAVGLNYKDGPFYGDCETGGLPIALCIAALKAREVINEN